MARLSQPEVRELLRKAKNAAAILRCHRQHERLRYHVQPIEELSQVSPYHRHFMAWVKTLLPEDKYLQFEKFLRFPLPTTDVSERIFTQLERALQADNQYIRVDMASPEQAADMEEYRSEAGDNAFWTDKGFQAIQTAINSIYLVDLPRTQVGQLPEPYGYLLPVSPANIWDVDFKDDGVADYIIFNISRNIRAVFDDEFYRIVERREGMSWDTATFAVEVPHSYYDAATGVLVDGLGYTPAARLWDNLLNAESNAIETKSPITKLLGRMDEYLFDYFSLRYYEAFGTWPILWQYTNPKPEHLHPLEPGIKCHKGYFLVPQPDAWDGTKNVPQKARVVPCEECRKSGLTGPGTIKNVTPPQEKTAPDNREPAGWIEANPEIIELAEKRLQAKAEGMVEAAVGRNTAVANAQPRNEMDVVDSTEVAQSMLLHVKLNFEAIWKWSLETKAILRHGRRNFRRATVDLGDEFFLKTEEQVKADYKSAKDAGLPDYILAPIRELVSDTKFRNNDEQRLKQRILANLQPYPDRSDAELQAWLTASPQTLNANLLRLRMNFMGYIMQFEREQEMSLVDVASAVPFGAKIQLIRERLVAYVTEDFAGENVLVPIAPPVVAPAPPQDKKPTPEPV